MEVAFVPTPLEDIPKHVEAVRKGFESEKTRSYDYRVQQLLALFRMVDENKDRITEACKLDLGKCRLEAEIADIGTITNEIAHTISHLKEWMAPEKVKGDILTAMDTLMIKPEPLGVVCVIGAWNYPIQLSLAPAVQAISAGNAVLLKPSEVASNCAMVLADLVPKYMDPETCRVVNGGVQETTALLKEKFDHIFYTGNSMIGKVIARAAAEHLTPCTLELGGKSPVIAWGKFMNAGQTCVAPDYVLVEGGRVDQLGQSLKTAVQEFYGEDPSKSADFGRIVNERHTQRIANLLNNAGTVVFGGTVDVAQRYIAPTVLTDVSPAAPIMQDEIFGPVLPLLPVESVDEAISFINKREKPLALYVFSGDRKVVDRVLERTSSGGVCVNDVVMHITDAALPFGGVGNSGTGAYHGKHGFDRLSHRKGVMVKSLGMEAVNNMRYPPYTDRKMYWMRKLLFKAPSVSGAAGVAARVAVPFVAAAGLAYWSMA
eukprot:Colp12_sorted_trinity150504_noHs@7184